MDKEEHDECENVHMDLEVDMVDEGEGEDEGQGQGGTYKGLDTYMDNHSYYPLNTIFSILDDEMY